MSKQSNLNNAKSAQNDEFYTRLSDIEDELKHYSKHFRGATVYLNCDDPEVSKFWTYFEDNFEVLGLRSLLSTHIVPNGASYVQELLEGSTEALRRPLSGNGSYNSPECIELLKEADVVVTNPPFSLFREYMALLGKHKKKFLTVGSQNAIAYKEIFPLIQDNKLWLGVNSPKAFTQPDGTEKKFGNIGWFTNLKHDKRNEELILVREYDEEVYPKYDDCDVIEVSKVAEIPEDYTGVMGVPITFLNKHNPEQFEILGLDCYWEGNPNPKRRFYIGGEKKYARILIKHKTGDDMSTKNLHSAKSAKNGEFYTRIENYRPTETKLHESDGEIVMPIGEQATIRLKPFGFAVVELSIDNSWVALDQRQITDLRFALGEMLRRIGVEHVV